MKAEHPPFLWERFLNLSLNTHNSPHPILASRGNEVTDQGKTHIVTAKKAQEFLPSEAAEEALPLNPLNSKLPSR